jgi:hypothetical protein
MRFSETRCEQNNVVRPHDFALVGKVNAAAIAERPKVINRVLPVTERYFATPNNGSVNAGFNLGGKSHLLSFVVVACHASIISIVSSSVKLPLHLFGGKLKRNQKKTKSP